MRNCNAIVGDWVRPADSSIRDVGCVVGSRDAHYLIVEWDSGLTSTHRRESLECVLSAVPRPVLRMAMEE